MKQTIAILITVLLVLSLQIGCVSAFAAELPGAAPDAFVVRDPAPEMDPALTFDWELLLKQNDLKNILSWFPAVKIYSKSFDMDNCTWLFRHGENPVMLTDAYGSVYGQFRGCYFELAESTDGVVRPQINGLADAAGSLENLNSFFLGYIGEPVRMQLDRIEGDLIWADAYYLGGYREKIAFDRGILVIREIMGISDTGEVVNVTAFDYDKLPTKYAFLDSWDDVLRRVDVLWESYSGMERQLRSETLWIPMDWEYYPVECRWGEVTPYTNDRYIGPYQYPGDGVNYSLYLTTAKG
ncbi:MAG: hypothetical protein IJV40_01125 [Oscillospiraceae bacterium]|nr:hypothetical protein [Oscillospiraceae bacterium]